MRTGEIEPGRVAQHEANPKAIEFGRCGSNDDWSSGGRVYGEVNEVEFDANAFAIADAVFLQFAGTTFDEAVIHEAVIHEAVIHEAVIHEAVIHETATHEGRVASTIEPSFPQYAGARFFGGNRRKGAVTVSLGITKISDISGSERPHDGSSIVGRRIGFRGIVWSPGTSRWQLC